MKKGILVEIRWSGTDVEIILVDEGNKPAAFIEGHCVNLIYAKYQGKTVRVETKKPWLVNSIGVMYKDL